MPTLLHKVIRRVFRKRKTATGPLLPEEEVLFREVTGYHEIIEQYIPYFRELTETEKKKFISRTWYFRQCKTFHFVGMAELQEIPILVSAAAVQLTFGLSKYRLNYFRDIYIMPDAYQYGNYGQYYIGHVSPKGIYISWKHFLQGYADEKDNVNVAIHEMAHALNHSIFIDQMNVDKEFKADFASFPAVFGPAWASNIVNRRSYLRPYAYHNLQEFWAVSVEAFFENPVTLKERMPSLYHAISEILNQDPASRIRISTNS